MFDISGNGISHGMRWRKVSNDTIAGGVMNTNSILVGDTIYAFARGEVQTVELSQPATVRMSSMEKAQLTPKRCFSGNVYDEQTGLIYVIGGSDCNDAATLYADTTISQNMTRKDSGNGGGGLFANFGRQDWIYFGSGFAIAILAVCAVYVVVVRMRRNKKKDENLLSGHIQETLSSGNIVSSAKSGRRKLSTVSEVSDRPGVDM